MNRNIARVVALVSFGVMVYGGNFAPPANARQSSNSLPSGNPSPGGDTVSLFVTAGGASASLPLFSPSSHLTACALSRGSSDLPGLTVAAVINSKGQCVVTATATTTATANLQTINYTVMADNSNTSASAQLAVVVRPKAPVLTFASPTVVNGALGKPIAPLTSLPSSTGGLIGSCSLSPSLPNITASVNSSGACVVSGTPTAIVSQNYTVTASNGAGISKTQIKVNVSPSLTYSPIILRAKTAISAVTPSVGSPIFSGLPTSVAGGAYSISPSATALPPGVTFNPRTGVFSGTPTSFFYPTTFTVTYTSTSPVISTTGTVQFWVTDASLETAASFASDLYVWVGDQQVTNCDPLSSVPATANCYPGNPAYQPNEISFGTQILPTTKPISRIFTVMNKSPKGGTTVFTLNSNSVTAPPGFLVSTPIPDGTKLKSGDYINFVITSDHSTPGIKHGNVTIQDFSDQNLSFAFPIGAMVWPQNPPDFLQKLDRPATTNYPEYGSEIATLAMAATKTQYQNLKPGLTYRSYETILRGPSGACAGGSPAIGHLVSDLIIDYMRTSNSAGAVAAYQADLAQFAHYSPSVLVNCMDDLMVSLSGDTNGRARSAVIRAFYRVIPGAFTGAQLKDYQGLLRLYGQEWLVNNDTDYLPDLWALGRFYVNNAIFDGYLTTHPPLREASQVIQIALQSTVWDPLERQTLEKMYAGQYPELVMGTPAANRLLNTEMSQPLGAGAVCLIGAAKTPCATGLRCGSNGRCQ